MTKTEKRILYLMAREYYGRVSKSTICMNTRGYLYIRESLESLEKQGLLKKEELEVATYGRTPTFWKCTPAGEVVVEDLIASGQIKNPHFEQRGGCQRKAG